MRSLRHIEPLELRLVLDSLGPAAYDAIAPHWFDTVRVSGAESSTLSTGSLGAASSLGDSSGPIDPQALVSRWIVRLTSEAAAQVSSVSNVEPILRAGGLPYEVQYGLGLPGQVLVDIPGRTYHSVVDDLSQNPCVAQFEPDVAIIGPQSTSPNDELFRNQTGLANDGTAGGTPGADIHAAGAWNVTHGSSQTVVGVIDSGLDYTHEDLYENVWINQGEIPAAIKALHPDKDGDGLITFRDLNDSRNAGLVADANGNQRSDGYDLIHDHRWADSVDTDGNGYADDLIGWNFQAKNNDPYDDYRHGTHVAGIIGAAGNNSQGVAGVNWDVSLMSLKFLDQYNRGLTSDAILAINYATMMHTSFGVNIRVTNNSWGRSGDPSPALRDAIRANGEADMLFVTAAGNGNILGRGVDNDLLPFYPASFDLPNILSVAATDYNDQLAVFSNYGRTSVDLAAPGVGILSTEPHDATNPQGNYGWLNGTSMAAPFVTGTAALLWSQLPDATADEVRQAILAGVDPVVSLKNRVATGGRLNAARALATDTYRPRVTLQSAADITDAGGAVQEISVAIHDNTAVKLTSLDGYDLVVTPIDRAGDPLTGVLKRTAPTSDAADVVGVYWMNAPGGRWDPADNGVYQISLQANEIKDTHGNAALPQVLGQFRVNVPNIGQITVDSTADAPDANLQDGRSDDGTGRSTLRSAVMQANATAGENTILLPAGTYVLTIPSTGGDSAASGDLDVTDASAKLTIIGDRQGGTIIDAAGLDRVFHVFAGAQLDLQNVTIRGGQAASGQDGGGVLNAGGLSLTDSRITSSHAVRGGGVYNTGPLTILRSTLDHDGADDAGGGLYNSAAALVSITNSTFSDNSAVTAGGAIYSSGQLQLLSVTVAGNSTAGHGGGISNTGTVTVRNTILAANQSTSTDPDVHGVFTTLGNNLVGNAGAATGFADGVLGDLIGSSSQSRDPVLGPLADNGGLTPTRALLVGSPAINAGTFTDAPATDQRGTTRPKSGQGQMDIGAFERNVVEIHGVKYHDANGNGVRDPSEPGLAGWTMYLDLNNNGHLDATEPSTLTGADNPATAETDETGQYAFTSLAPGSYAVREVPQDNFTQTFPRDLMFTATPALTVGRNPVALAAEDFNRDGLVDLVVANRDDNNLTVLVNQRSGLFETSGTVAVGTAPTVVATSHLNDDSYPDLVVGNQGSHDLSILWNDGQGAFQVAGTIAVGGQPLAVAVTDTNGDGRTDLAVVTASATDVLVLLQDAQGQFSATQRVAVGSALTSAIAADVDGDRDPDLVVLSRTDASLRILTNDGHGLFAVSNPIFSGGLSPSAVVAADLDGDSDLDLAIANQGSNAVSVMLNQGNGTFGAAVNLPVGSAPISVAAADADRNGSLDLVTLNQGDNTISVLINQRDTSHDVPGQSTGVSYYINDSSTTDDLYTTAVGNDANSGLTPATPKASLQAILDAYDLGPGDVVYVDTGYYGLTSGVVVDASDGGDATAPVVIRGATAAAGTTLDLQGNGGDVVVSSALYVTFEDFCLTGATTGAGFWSQGGDVLRHSRVYGNATGVNADYMSVQNNVIFDNTGVGILAGQSEVINNTIVATGAVGVACDYPNSTVRNNIIQVSGVGKQALRVESGGWTSDYNDLYATGGATIGMKAGVDYATLATWQTATGQDRHSFSADPLFVDPAAGDFHVRSSAGRYDPASGSWVSDAESSPTIDAGDPTVAVGVETAPNGNRVNQGADGGALFASRSPVARRLRVIGANATNVAVAGNMTVNWDSQGTAWTTGDGTLKLDYSSDGGATWITMAGGAAVPVNTRQFVWDTTTAVPNIGTRFLWRVSSNAEPTVADNNGVFFTLHNGPLSYYVNDESTAADVCTTAVGNVANDGLTPGTPKASLQAILDAYDLGPGDVVYVDTGYYRLTSGVVIDGGDGGGDATAPVTIRGSSAAAGTTLDLQGNGGDVVVSSALYVTFENFCLTGATTGAGFWSQGGDVLRHSRVYGNATGVNADYMSVQNNVIFNNTGVGILAGQSEVINNTIVAAGAVGVDCDYPNSTVRNNIIQVSGVGKQALRVESGGWTSDYNDLYATGGATIGMKAGVDYATLATWQTATGQDRHSMTADPLFSDPAGRDFHVRSSVGRYDPASGNWVSDAESSATIDAGDPTVAVGAEISPNGNRINQGADGGTAESSRSPAVRRLRVIAANVTNVAVTGNTTVYWDYQGTDWETGDATLNVAYSGDAGVTWTTMAGGAAVPVSARQFSWDTTTAVPNAGTRFLWRVSSNAEPTLSANNGVLFTLHNGPLSYYVNDDSTTSDMYATAAGNDVNDGQTPATPKASLQALLDAYDLGSGDVVYVDTGYYRLTTGVMIDASDGGDGTTPVTIRGSTVAAGTTLDLQGNSGNVVQSNASYVTVENFCLTGARGAGAYNGAGFRGGHWNTLRDSRVYGNATGASLAGYTPVSRNNAIFANTEAAIVLEPWADAAQITSNTLVATNADGVVVRSFSGYAADVVRNNIIEVSGEGKAAVRWDGGGLALDYNDLCATSGAAAGYLGATAYATLAAWQTATGQDLHSISADPLFADAAGGDFQLRTGSPAIDAGDNSSVVGEFDARGIPRILDGDMDRVAKVDLGAFEFVPPVFFVNSTRDAVDLHPGDGEVDTGQPGESTLRAAIMEANAHPGDDTIMLDARICELHIQGDDDAAFAGDLDVTDTTGTLTILGAGSDLTTIDARQLDRVFQVTGGASLRLVGVTITGGSASTGGGIHSDGRLVVEESVVRNNSAGWWGGGIYATGTWSLIRSTIADNSATDDGGGIADIGSGHITGSTISGNRAGRAGGGIRSRGSVTVVSSQIVGNSATWGAGIAGGIDSTASLTLDAVDIRNNVATDAGGGIEWSDSCTIRRSTITGNRAQQGAGIYLGGGHAEISTSTISGNIAETGDGGGLSNRAVLFVTDTTITGNSAGGAGQGVLQVAGELHLGNSIVAGNGARGSADVGGAAVSSTGHNLIGAVTVGAGFADGVNADHVGTLANPIDPKLGPLQDNGGPTWTHALLAGSAAIDAGTHDGAPTADQRGAPRILDGNGDGTAVADIGAVEYFDPSWFFVDSFEDTVDAHPGDGIVADANGHRTLRAAIVEANARPGDDGIVLAPGTYELSIPGSGEDASATGDLDVTDSTGTLTILGGGADATAIDAQQLDRVLEVASGASLRLLGVTITGGRTEQAGGGVQIDAGGNAVIERSTLTKNYTGFAGGGVHVAGGSVTVEHSTISDNSSAWGGGIGSLGANSAITLDHSEILRNTATIEVGGVGSQGTLSITDCTIAGNSSGTGQYGGGGIGTNGSVNGSVTITDSAITNNSSGTVGGGVRLGGSAAGGSVRISRTTISGNTAAQQGGGIYNWNVDAMIQESTVAGNSAVSDGGGVVNDSTATLTLVNVTVSGNTALHGGGLINAGDLTVTNSTITNNSATDASPGVIQTGGAFRIQNSLLAGNSGGSDVSTQGAARFLSLGHNLIGITAADSGLLSGVNGDLVGTAANPIDPLLSPLRDNGGSTLTHMPLPGSPAIDAGENNGAPVTDQTGIARPKDGDGDGVAVVDIGAFEWYPAEIRGRKFEDMDGDGQYDPGEPGLAGWTIQLTGVDGWGNPVSVTTTTAADDPTTVGANEAGQYWFAQLLRGTYTVREVEQAGWTPSYPSAPGTYSVNLSLGQTVSDRDFGSYRLDFGDAPDPSYPTRLASNGARHRIVDGMYLGAGVDPEPDAFSSASSWDAARDFSAIENPHNGWTSGVIVMQPDGSWGSFVANDWEFNTESGFGSPRWGTSLYNDLATWGNSTPDFWKNISAQPHAGVEPGQVSLHPGASSVEVLRWKAPVAGLYEINGRFFDGNTGETQGWIYYNLGTATQDMLFHDATLSDRPSFAREMLLTAGDTIDVVVGLVNGYGSNDTPVEARITRVDDDGVVFSGPLVAGRAAHVAVTASTSGLLNAWLDFNADGDWADAGEQIFADQPLVAGVNQLTFSVPIGVTVNTEAFARFRYSTQHGLAFDSPAPDGEVEDYPVTILPSLIISDAASVTEGDIGNTNAIFTVTLTPAGGREVSVDYSTRSDTATSGVDFLPVSGTLHFAAGETTKTILVPVVGDFEHEPTETFSVNLSNPVNAEFQDSQAVGTIVDDDPLLTVNSSLDKIDLTPGNGAVNTGTANEITLRAAIMEANALAGPDAIVLPAGTYRLTLAGISEDAAAKGDLDVAPGGLTITGAGAGTTFIDAAGLDRAFEVRPGATLTLVGVTVKGGHAKDLTNNGGGIENQGSLVLVDCVVDANTADGVGGGVDNGGSLTLTRSTLSNNGASEGGALRNLDSAVTTATDSVLANNTATLYGGAIISSGSLDFTRATFRGNRAIVGGAILNGGDLTVRDTTLADNLATQSGGAVFNIADIGTVTVSGSSFIHNSAGAAGAGGALCLGAEGAVNVSNSTFTQNAAGQTGGAIDNDAGVLTLTNVTIAGNSTAGQGGGLYNNVLGLTAVQNTLVAQNTATLSDPDLSGAFTSLGHNLIGRRGGATGFTNGTNGDQVGSLAVPLDPLLRPLDDNGGPTLTMGLQPGSPALDCGSNQDAPATDQRGYLRPEDGDLDGTAVIDVGAFELTYNLPPVIPDQSFSVDENVAQGTVVGLVQFSGPEANDVVALSLVSGNTNGAFSLDPQTGQLTVAAMLDHEQLDAYHLTIRGEDRGHRVTTATLTIEVHDLNEPPTLVGSGISDRARQDGTTTETVALSSIFSDPDSGDTLTYAASSSNPALVDVAVQPDGVLSFIYKAYTALQDRTPAVVTVTATDSDGLPVSDTFTVTVTPTKTFEYVLVVVAQPTPQAEVTTLPTSLGSVATGGTFYVEVWLRDLFVPGLTGLPPTVVSQGVLQGAIDVTFRQDLSLGQTLDHSGIFDLASSYTGAINQAAGLVTNFGGKALFARQGVTPNYGRLGIIRFAATAQGQQVFSLYVDGQVTPTSRSASGAAASGKINPNQLRLAAPVTVSIVPQGGSVPFAPAVSVPAGTNPTALVLADLDGDGDKDLGVANASGSQVSLLWDTPGFSQVVQLSDGEVAAGVDFGDRAWPGQIRGRVFHDLNRNGQREAFEPGLKSAVVYLDLNHNGQLDADEPSRTTDDTGSYAFTNLSALTTYAVAEVVPNGATLSAPAGDGRYPISLGAGEVRTDVDFGNTFEGGVSGNSLTGTLFLDANGDGKRNAGESGWAGVTVFLDLNGNGQRDADEPTATTRADLPGTAAVDESGTYEFASLGAGTYQVRIVAPADLRQTFPLGNSFTTTELRADGGPRALAVGDFNADGRSDLAVANSISNTVTILTNLGAAEFATTATVPVGLGASAVVSADLNGDQWADLAVTNAYASNVSVLLNRGDGTFAAAQFFATGIGPSSIAAGDFDHDGDLDLAIANDASNSVTVLLNDGHGSFPTHRTYTTDDSPVAIVAMDLNGDNYVDLAAANIDSDNVTLLINDQHGGFVAAANLPVGDSPFALAAADFNADGRPDLAVANVLSDNVSILLNQGDGVFEAAKNYSGGQGPSSLAAADLDADGAVDLVVTNGNAGNLSILRNRGDGTFSDPTNFGQANFPTGLPLAVIAADINHDGTVDLAVANGDSDNVSVLTDTLVAGSQTVVLAGVTGVGNVNFGVQQVNVLPTLDAIGNVTIREDAPEQIVGLTGISPGTNETQPLQLTVSSVPNSLIPAPAIVYTAGQSTAQLVFRPAADQSGVVVLTVTVTDGGLDGRLATTADNGSTVRTFTVTVTAVNDPPVRTGGNVTPLTVQADSGTSSLGLEGLAYGAGGGVDEATQPLTYSITAVPASSLGDVMLSDGTTVVTPGVYSLTQLQGLQFRPAANATGQGELRFRVQDNGGTTNTGNDTLDESLTITVAKRDNVAPGDIALSSQTVAEHLSGVRIGSLSAVDPDAGDTVNFTVADGRFEIVAGQLKLKADQSFDHSRETTVSVQVTATDSGQPPLSRTETFAITVTANPHPWQNPGLTCDVDHNGAVLPLDVLILITELNYPTIRNPDGSLPTARAADAQTPFWDPTGDGALQPIDVLLVITYINNPPRAAAEGEALGLAPAAANAATARDAVFAAGWASPRVVTEAFRQLPEALVSATAPATTATMRVDRLAARACFARHDKRWLDDGDQVLDDLAADVAQGWTAGS